MKPTILNAIFLISAPLMAVNAYSGDLNQSTSSQDTHAAAAQLVKPFFIELDCEHLGYVQPGEALDHFYTIFNRLDKDQSRSIEKEELFAAKEFSDNHLSDVTFELADKNHDGSISVLEFRAHLKRAVETLDTDNNGEVFPADLVAAQ